MQDSAITVQGRVASDPEMKVSRNNNPFATFRVASTPRRQVSGAPGTYEDGETSWFTVFAWGNLGANVLRSIEKGQPVVVHGRLSAREFKRDDGSLGTSVSIVASGVGHDLTWGQTVYEKVSKPSYGSGDKHDEALRTIQAESEGYGDPQRDEYLLAERPAGRPGGRATEDAGDGAGEDGGEALTGPLVEEPAA